MKRVSRFCVIILFLLTTSINAQQYTITISNNPSFENWTDELPDDWLLKYNPITTSISQSTDADTGDYALGITIKSSSFELISITQNVSAKPNTDYKFSAVFKGTFVVDSEIYFEWGWFNSSGLLIREEFESSKLVINENATIDDFFGVIQRPTSPENTTSMILAFNLWTNDAEVIIDDFVVSYVSDEPPETTNTTFENETSFSEIISDNQSDDNSVDFTQNISFLLVSLLIVKIIVKKIQNRSINRKWSVND